MGALKHRKYRLSFNASLLLISGSWILIFPDFTEALVDLDEFLGLFENCTVKLHNYRSIHVPISKTPVTIETNSDLQFDHGFDWTEAARIPFHCLAILYVLPEVRNGSSIFGTLDIIMNTFKNKHPKKSEQEINMLPRFDILVDRDKLATSNGWLEFANYLAKFQNSYGLILDEAQENVFGSERFLVEDNLQVVNRLQLAHVKQVVQSVNLNRILEAGRRLNLDKIVADVSDVRNNPDVPWMLEFSMQKYIHLLYSKRKVNIYTVTDSLKPTIRFLMRPEITVTFRNSRLMLKPESISEEGLENVVFARMALTDNVTIADKWTQVAPSITFDDRDGQVMRAGREFGFITCAPSAGGYVWRTFTQVISGFAEIFDLRIYYGLFLAYLLPSVGLGLLYHGVLKKRIIRKYWIKWDPFTWGIRALIRQAGDRRLNSKRFGWMVPLVTAWLLASIVICVSFHGRNMRFIMEPGAFARRLVSLRWLAWMNVTSVTDTFGSWRNWERTGNGIDSYKEIAKYVQWNRNIAYVTYEDRIAGVMNWIRGEWNLWQEVGWCDRYSKMSRGSLHKWDLDYEAKYGYEETVVTGWKLKRWEDNRILWRLRRMEGESGLVAKWRQVMRRVVKGRGMLWESGKFLERPTMRGNIKWLFAVGLIGLAVGLAGWGGEWFLWMIWTKPERKRTARRKMTRDEGVEVRRTKVPRNDGNGESVEKAEENLVAAALRLAEEEQKGMGSAPIGKMAMDVKVKSRPVDLGLGVDDDSELEGDSVGEVKADIEPIAVGSNSGDGNEDEEGDEKAICEIVEMSDDDESALGTLEIVSDLESSVPNNDNRSRRGFNDRHSRQSTVSSAPPAGRRKLGMDAMEAMAKAEIW